MLREDLDQGQRAALASWLSFTTTFAAVRGITYSIRAGRGPFTNVSAGGEHLHHYLWGIGMLAGVGAAAVHGEERLRSHPAVALTYGSGLALIVDEFALLLPETGREAAHSVARRISSSIAEDSNGPRISVSVGVGVYPLDGDNVESLVSAADNAMYVMKRERKAADTVR